MTAPIHTPFATRTVPYLRVVVTPRCSLACTYCHAEGDVATDASAGGLLLEELVPLLRAGVTHGVRKLKFLGGEPLLRRDLPAVISALRTTVPDLDVSLITAGAVDAARLDACFDAGLSRANLSIHGWAPVAFAARTGRPHAYDQRARVLDRLLAHGRFLKVNYVWRSRADDGDLAGLQRVLGAPLTNRGHRHDAPRWDLDLDRAPGRQDARGPPRGHAVCEVAGDRRPFCADAGDFLLIQVSPWRSGAVRTRRMCYALGS